MQLTHTSHGHKDTQAAIVFARIAHSVKVRASQQALGLRVAAVVDAHHIAHGIDGNLIKAAVLAHSAHQALGAGAVCIGQVGDRQLPALSVAGVAVDAQALVPVPY